MLKRFLHLEVENIRLTAAEKSTVLLATISFCVIAFVIGACSLLFLSVGIVKMLSLTLPVYWTYLILGLFYMGLFILLFAFKRVIIIDPIARFMSRLFVEPPEN